MKVKLVFPPAWQATKQYASLPCLAAYMRANGIDVEQYDVNLELFDTIISEEYLTQCLKELKAMEEKPEQIELMEYLCRNVEACKATIRSEAAMDMEVYRSCAAFLKVTMHMINLVWGKEENIGFGNYSFRGYYNADGNSICNCVRDIRSGKISSRLEKLLRLQIPALAEGTGLLGLSVTTSCQLIPSVLIAAMCKQYNPQIKIVMGGALATRWALKTEVLRPLFEFIDYFSFYEGEYPLTVLTRYLEGNARLEDAPAVAYLKDGEIVLNPPMEKQLSMDELPTPEYSKKYLGRYFSPTPIVTLFTSRGCYWNRCAFCDHAAVYQDCYRVRKTEKILDDIETCVREYGARFIDINDEAISAPIMRSLSQGILDRGLNVIWRNDARLDGVLDAQTLQLAHKAGLRMLYFGLESYNDRVLKLMNKGIHKENVLPIIKAASEAGIWTLVYIIRGFPTETAEEFGDTARFIYENRQYINIAETTRFSVSTYSDVSLHPEKYGIAPTDIEHMDLAAQKIYVPDETSSLTDPATEKYLELIRQCREKYATHLIRILFMDGLLSLRKREQAGERFVVSMFTPLFSKNGDTSYLLGNHSQKSLTRKMQTDLVKLLTVINREKALTSIYDAFSSEFGIDRGEAEATLLALTNAKLISDSWLM